jgi:hypothetical protein
VPPFLREKVEVPLDLVVRVQGDADLVSWFERSILSKSPDHSISLCW